MLANTLWRLLEHEAPPAVAVCSSGRFHVDSATSCFLVGTFHWVNKTHFQRSDEARRLHTRNMVHKKGDVEEVGNYRPICTLPALYTLFSTLTNNRLYPRLDRVQQKDQGGLATYRLLEQKYQEWGVKNVGCDGGLHEGV